MIWRQIRRALANRLRGRTGAGPRDRLTPAQWRVARLVAAGLPNKLIARRLGRSEQTVKNELSMAFARLGVRSRVELARYVWEHESAAGERCAA